MALRKRAGQKVIQSEQWMIEFINLVKLLILYVYLNILFCFCVKGRSFQGVNVSELEFIWKWPSSSVHCRHLV